MKSLKPSHREKKRYLLVKGKDASKKMIDDAILSYVGVLGYAKASPQIVKKTVEGVILAINRKEINKVRASFLVSGKDIKVVRVSGVVRKVK